MDEDGDRWNDREAQEGMPSTSNNDAQANSYPVVSPSQSLYSQYPVSQSLDNGFQGFQLLVNQAGIYQPVRYDNISSSDGTHAMPVDLHSSVGQGSYVTMVAPPGGAAPQHYSVMNVPRTVAAADTHSHPFTLASGDSTQSYALSQATTSGLSSSDGVQLYSTQHENGSSEAVPLVSHSTGAQDGVISSGISMNIPLTRHIHPVHQEYSSNEPDTTQEEDMDQTLSSDPDLALETSDSGVDSGPSSTVLVPEAISASANMASASSSMPVASTSLNTLHLAMEADGGISTSQQIAVSIDGSGAGSNLMVGMPPGPIVVVDGQEPSTSGTVDDSLENGGHGTAVEDDDSQSSFSVPLFVESNVSLAKNRSKRKSTRMASLSVDGAEAVPKPRYEPVPYDHNQIWCDPCQRAYPGECTEHPLTCISDKVVLSRAWSSLPSQLTVFRVMEGSELGVFAKKSIPEQTQFGPFVAELVETKDMLTKQDFILQIDREDGTHFIDASDENVCNWMMFVRPANSYIEQNMVAYQHGTEIFFVTTQEIEPKQELKVWYSAHYAHHIGAQAFTANDGDISNNTGQEAKWSCYECNQQFVSSAQLQSHLVVHDEPVPGTSKAQDPSASEPDYVPEESEKRPVRRKFGRANRSRGRAAKKAKDNSESFQS